jgi:TolA-binding protein
MFIKKLSLALGIIIGCLGEYSLAIPPSTTEIKAKLNLVEKLIDSNLYNLASIELEDIPFFSFPIYFAKEQYSLGAKIETYRKNFNLAQDHYQKLSLLTGAKDELFWLHLKKGELYENYQIEKSLAEYKTALNLYPFSTTELFSYLNFKIGKLLYKKGDYKEASLYLQKAYTTGKENFSFFKELESLLISSLYITNDYDKLLSLPDIKSESGLLKIGYLLIKYGSLTAGLQALSKIKSPSLLPWSDLILAETYFKKNDYDTTINYCNKVLKSDNKEAVAYALYLVGFTYAEKKDNYKAIISLKEAKEKKKLLPAPLSISLILKLAELYIKENKLKEAQTYLKEIIEEYSAISIPKRVYWQLFLIALKEENLKEAAHWTEKLAPEGEEVAEYYIAALLLLGNEYYLRETYKEAAKLYDKLYVIYSSLYNKGLEEERWAELALRYGLCTLALKDTAKARIILKTISEESPFYPYALFNIASSYYEEGDYEEAKENYLKLRNKFPELAATTTLRVGHCYFNLKEYSKAAAEYISLINHPGLADAGVYYLALCHYKEANLATSTQLLVNFGDKFKSSVYLNRAIFLLGFIKEEEGKYAEAIREYIKLPQREVNLRLAVCYVGLGEYAAAANIYKTSLQLGRINPQELFDQWSNCLEVWGKNADPEEIEAYRVATVQNFGTSSEEAAKLLLTVARYYYYKDKEKAKNFLKDLLFGIEQVSGRCHILYQLSLWAIDDDDLKTAYQYLNILEILITSYPEFVYAPEALFLLGECLFQKKDYKEAERIFLKLQEKYGKSRLDLYQAAKIYIDKCRQLR